MGFLRNPPRWSRVFLLFDTKKALQMLRPAMKWLDRFRLGVERIKEEVFQEPAVRDKSLDRRNNEDRTGNAE